MAPPISLEQRQKMSIEDRLALLERDMVELIARSDIQLNYFQAVAEGLGIRRSPAVQKLDDEIEELRGGPAWEQDPDRPTDPEELK